MRCYRRGLSMSSRYEREIEEILQKSNWRPSPGTALVEGVRSVRGRLSVGSLLGSTVGKLSPTILIALSAGLGLVTLALQGSMPGLRLVLIVSALVFFLLAFVVGFIARRATQPKNWRGRYIDDQPPSIDDWMRRIRGQGPRDDR
jgi:hypothetical protein